MMGFGKCKDPANRRWCHFGYLLCYIFGGVGGMRNRKWNLFSYEGNFDDDAISMSLLRDPIHGGVPKHQPSRDGE